MQTAAISPRALVANVGAIVSRDARIHPLSARRREHDKMSIFRQSLSVFPSPAPPSNPNFDGGKKISSRFRRPDDQCAAGYGARSLRPTPDAYAKHDRASALRGGPTITSGPRSGGPAGRRFKRGSRIGYRTPRRTAGPLNSRTFPGDERLTIENRGRGLST